MIARLTRQRYQSPSSILLNTLYTTKRINPGTITLDYSEESFIEEGTHVTWMVQEQSFIEEGTHVTWMVQEQSCVLAKA